MEQQKLLQSFLAGQRRITSTRLSICDEFFFFLGSVFFLLLPKSKSNLELMRYHEGNWTQGRRKSPFFFQPGRSNTHTHKPTPKSACCGVKLIASIYAWLSVPPRATTLKHPPTHVWRWIARWRGNRNDNVVCHAGYGFVSVWVCVFVSLFPLLVHARKSCCRQNEPEVVLELLDLLFFGDFF